MSQSVLLGLPLPVTLAFGALLLVSMIVARVVTALRKPAVVRQAEPSFRASTEADTALRRGHLQGQHICAADE
jgi:hypothetical protein